MKKINKMKKSKYKNDGKKYQVKGAQIFTSIKLNGQLSRAGSFCIITKAEDDGEDEIV